MAEERREEHPTRLAFDPAEERVIDSMARWMGVLGRFQVLAGGILVVSVLGVAIAYGATEAIEPPPGQAADTPPLITLGEISLEAVVAILAAVFALGALVLRAGVRMIDAAEELEHVVHAPIRGAQHLESALVRVRSFYRIEALLTLLVLAAVIAWVRVGAG